ncbi:Phosphoglucomutase/phosphomannomutasealpha/beta/alpha domain I family protein [Aphelenchoides avenae]|nr:Phosphoglucomutase/phosphomannomutasealpha/beta/alpha domain I family protein [Aphelenchus avenae]
MDIQQFQNVDHLDAIHHVEFDFHGRRVATASSDKIVCIWDKVPTTVYSGAASDNATGSAWVRTAFWKTHGGAVWKVRWAHPEYGQVVATCSFDTTVHIFEEGLMDSSDQSARTGVHAGKDTANKWRRRATLSCSSDVIDIQFAPHYLGLLLAACTSKGRVIIYEAEDVLELESWNVVNDIEVVPFRLSSLSWTNNRFRTPLLATSSDDVNAPANEKLTIFKVNLTSPGFRKSDIISRDKFEFADQVSCVSFGPTAGLAYHRLAVAVGGSIQIYKVTIRDDDGDHEDRAANHQDDSDFEISLRHTLGNSPSQVVRLSWNVIGDVICAVYADGMVRMWKYNTFTAKWDVISAVSPPIDTEKASNDTVYY